MRVGSLLERKGCVPVMLAVVSGERMSSEGCRIFKMYWLHDGSSWESPWNTMSLFATLVE